MSQVTENLPPEYEYGYVVARVIQRVADTAADEDRLPEAKGASGTVTFTPLTTRTVASNAIVLDGPTTVTLNNGHIHDGQDRGVHLVTGVYKVTFNVVGGSVPAITVEVLPSHTEANPLNLKDAMPYVPDPNGPEPIVTYELAQQILDAYTGGGTGGVSDHGALTGLDDDDHTIYLTEVRGDLRYYTQAQVDAALSGVVENSDPRLTNARTPVQHSHQQSDITGLATTLSGKVNDTDARLSDARTPLTHAHVITDVTGLTAALAGKADAQHTHPEYEPEAAVDPFLIVDWNGSSYPAQPASAPAGVLKRWFFGPSAYTGDTWPGVQDLWVKTP